MAKVKTLGGGFVLRSTLTCGLAGGVVWTASGPDQSRCESLNCFTSY